MSTTDTAASRSAGPRAEGASGAGAASAASRLGTPADNSSGAGQRTADEREDRRRGRRRESIAWRSRLWEWSSLPRLRNCGRVTHSTVGGPVLRLSTDDEGRRRAGVAGLQSCGSPWACPVCSRKIAAQRADELRDVLGVVASTGGCAHLMTFTMRHRAGQRLADLWTALSAAWGSVTSGRQVERERERWGLLGMVRVVEATHGEHGWHLHVHALVMFDTPVSREMAYELGGRMFARWERALVRRGLAAPLEDRGGLDVRPVDMGDGSLDAMAEYLAKITAEVTAQVAKEGRDGNRSPFAILRDALATGLADDVELWLEWEAASRNRRQLTWSRGLREWAGLHREQTDQEVAERDHHGEDVAAIAPASWPAVRPHLAELLDVAERDGIVGARLWLTERGHRWSSARSAPRCRSSTEDCST